MRTIMATWKGGPKPPPRVVAPNKLWHAFKHKNLDVFKCKFVSSLAFPPPERPTAPYPMQSPSGSTKRAAESRKLWAGERPAQQERVDQTLVLASLLIQLQTAASRSLRQKKTRKVSVGRFGVIPPATRLVPCS